MSTPVNPGPTPAPVFSNAVRVGLGFLVAAANALLVSNFIHIGAAEAALISSIILVFGTYGIVAPTKDSVHMSQTAALLLSVVAIVANYLLVSVWNPEVGLLVACEIVLSLLSSLGITPPQVARRSSWS